MSIKSLAAAAAVVAVTVAAAGCGSDTALTSSHKAAQHVATIAQTHTVTAVNAPTKPPKVKLPKPAASNPVCATVIKEWNATDKALNGDENASAAQMDTLAGTVSALGLPEEGKFLSDFATVLRDDAEGDFTVKQQNTAIHDFKIAVPAIKAHILAKCPSYHFTGGIPANSTQD